MGIEKEVYAGYITIDVDFEADELVEHMADAGVDMEMICNYMPNDTIVRGLRAYMCGDCDDPVEYSMLERLEELVKDARAQHERVSAAAQEVSDG
jgi:uncharacterized protein YlaI